jgi:hypothetical protein
MTALGGVRSWESCRIVQDLPTAVAFHQDERASGFQLPERLHDGTMTGPNVIVATATATSGPWLVLQH